MDHRWLNEFCRELEWPQPRRYSHKHAHRLTVWYESQVQEDLFLQINLKPCLAACVFAWQYKLCSGWCAIDTVNGSPQIEAARLGPWLHYLHFASENGRQQYSEAHPECVGFTKAPVLFEDAPRPIA